MTGRHRAPVPPPYRVQATFTYLAADATRIGLHVELQQFLQSRTGALPDLWETVPAGWQRVPGRRWRRRPAFRVSLTKQTSRLPEALATAAAWRGLSPDAVIETTP